MSERASKLRATAAGQVTALIELLSSATEDALARPCPTREKLGDGTVGALIAHTADNYARIADFIADGDRTSNRRPAARQGPHSMPRLFRALGQRGPDPQQHGPGAHHRPGRHAHETQYSGAREKPEALAQRLSATRSALSRVADLGDDQLDAKPPKDSFRFCDGERTLEQVISALLKHQESQLAEVRDGIS
jgi:hypothetical protein